MTIITLENSITLQTFAEVVLNQNKIALSKNVYERCENSCQFINKIKKEQLVYGLNTGFGPMVQYAVEDDAQIQLQYNLVRSHASGAGKQLNFNATRALVFARLISLIQGYSGVSKQTIDILITFLNKKLHPYIPEHGGVGASGDLVQLAHLALCMLGEGEFIAEDGKRVEAKTIFQQHKLSPMQFKSREGLALMNGTACMTGLGLLNIYYAEKQLSNAFLLSGIVNELSNAHKEHLLPPLSQVKKHYGQLTIAKLYKKHFANSKRLRERTRQPQKNGNNLFKEKIQEYYSLRCVPQILGPVYDTLQSIKKDILNELNSVNDNPVFDSENNVVMHGGNFHGDYVSLAMDKLKLVLTKMGMLAERQINYLAADYLNTQFPKFLNKGVPGLNYGMQGIQFTATSTIAENQTLSTSQYIHSIPTNSDNQDIVSMGTNSALIANRVVENNFQVFAVFWICAVQAASLLNIKDFAPISQQKLHHFAKIAPAFIEDTPHYKKIEQLIAALKEDNNLLEN